MKRYFVDASFWIALFDRSDASRGSVTACWQDLARQPTRLTTSDYVLDEAYTFFCGGT